MMPVNQREEDSQVRRRPLLIVPGWGAPFFQTEYVARKFEAEGLQAIRVRLPGLALGDLDGSAAAVGRQVLDTLEAHQVERVNVVGYSLGGLIARVYFQKLNGYQKLHRAVFLGAPQDGIYTGYPALFTPSGRQLIPGCDYLRELNERGPRCSSRRCLSIYLSKDGIIVPSKSALLSCGYNLCLERPIFHWSVVMSRAVIRKAAQFIKYGTLPEGAFAGDRATD